MVCGCGLIGEVVRGDQVASDDERMDRGEWLVCRGSQKEVLVMTQGREPFSKSKPQADAVCFFLRAGKERCDLITGYNPLFVVF